MLSVEPLLAEPREVSRTRVTAFHVQAPRHLRLHRRTRQHTDHDVPREPAHLGRRPREPPVHVRGDVGELRRVDQLRRHTVSKSKHRAFSHTRYHRAVPGSHTNWLAVWPAITTPTPPATL